MKKRILLAVLCSLFLLFLSGCSNPNSLQMDLSRGYGDNLKLLHLNASSQKKRERIAAFSAVVQEAEPLDKPFSMFAYYPDYLLEITPWDETGPLTVIIDVNGDFIDFYYPGPNPTESPTLYRSKTTAEEFFLLVNQP